MITLTDPYYTIACNEEYMAIHLPNVDHMVGRANWMLKEYGCTREIGTHVLVFEKDSDATMFLLKFSNVKEVLNKSYGNLK